MEKTAFSFREAGYEEIRDTLEDTAPQWCYLTDMIKAVHDWSILVNILKGEKYISFAKVGQYETHRENLKKLRSFIRKYGSISLYKEVFNDSKKTGNYCSYIGSVKTNGKKHSVKKCTQEDFYKYMKKAVKNLEEGVAETDRPLYEELMQEIENETLLPLQISKENGVIPCQVHKMELDRILENAEKYIGFLGETDETGKTGAEKIKAIFSFRIPYYVGPLSDRHKAEGSNVWIVRKEEGYIYPWNFDEKVDREKSNENFIKRMTNKCTYLIGEDVLPKNSLLYSKYMVLNELNNLKIRGNKISVELKQKIYEDLFMKHTKVTGKRLLEYLNANGYEVEKDDLSGFDQDFKASLSSYLDFEKKIFGSQMKNTHVQAMAENIILWKTIYGDDKAMLRTVIAKNYPGELTKEQINKIQSFRYSGWGNFSKKFLHEIEGTEYETGEVFTIIEGLWNTNFNLMQLLSSNFTFKKEIDNYNREQQEEFEKIDYDHIIKDLFVSPANKRAIWQTVQIAEEVRKIMGCCPEKIFVEMTRGGESAKKGKRTESRKNKLVELYKNCEKDLREFVDEIDHFEERDFRSRKLYLYYIQQGRCMYTNEPIDLDQLMHGSSKWDKDHIYPQSRIKDDSLDNLVLVNREVNARKSADLLSSDIQKKMRPFWKSLLEQGFITKKKYDRLTRTVPFTEEELAGFINRQLVETSQSSKAVAELLQRLYEKEGTEIVYVKAGLVSQFRQKKLKMLKSRRINDYHHARDAYLNIVVGNVYNARFTSNPLKWIRENANTNYSINAVFDHNVYRGKACVWNIKNEDLPNTMGIVRKTMEKNTVLHTEYTYCEKGELFNATIERKGGTGRIPIKKELPIEKYGGYKSANTSYFALIEFDGKKGERIVNLVGVPIYVANQMAYNHQALIEYFEKSKGLQNVKILYEKIKKNALLSINGFPMRIRGETEKQSLLKSDIQLVLDQEQEETVRKIEKYLEKNPNKEVSEAFDGLHDETLLALYDVLTDKLENTIYRKRPANQAENLRKGREEFCKLALSQRAFVLNEILTMLRCDNATTADLTLIGGSKNAGNIAISKNTMGKSRLVLIHQSVTGLFENRVILQP